jgi:hypothetical protein
MEEILLELSVGGSLEIETEKLPDLLKYCYSQTDLFTLRFEYFEKTVKVTLVDKYITIKK